MPPTKQDGLATPVCSVCLFCFVIKALFTKNNSSQVIIASMKVQYCVLFDSRKINRGLKMGKFNYCIHLIAKPDDEYICRPRKCLLCCRNTCPGPSCCPWCSYSSLKIPEGLKYDQQDWSPYSPADCSIKEHTCYHRLIVLQMSRNLSLLKTAQFPKLAFISSVTSYLTGRIMISA